MNQGKTAVVTGGSRGIGYAIAKYLAREGYDIWICARNRAKLEEARENLGKIDPKITIHADSVDLGDKAQLRAFAEKILSEWQSINVLVNNAGDFIPGSVLTEEDGTLEKLMEVNMYSAYYLTRFLFGAIEKQSGSHIFNISSIAGIQAYTNGGSYGISKAAMLGWSRNLREECKTKGVRVTAILPGATWTDSWAASGLPEARFMQPDDIAEAVMSAMKMTPGAVVEEIILRPQTGDV